MAKKIIAIRAGHGGSDPGAVNKNSNIIEKDINLSVVKKAANILKKDFEVIVIRGTDTTMSLSEGVNIANNKKADLFISVHHNSGGGRGCEVYHALKSANGKRLATLIVDAFAKNGQVKRNPAIKTKESERYPGKDYYTELGNTNMPAVITEYAFVDNASDIAMINSDAKLAIEANGIISGVYAYFGMSASSDNSKPSSDRETVLTVQEKLNDIRINNDNFLNEDGILGPNTITAIKNFQKMAGFKVTGEPSESLIHAIDEIIDCPLLKEGKSPSIPTRYIQWYFRIGIDGIFGSGTKRSVIDFQRKCRLDADGIVGQNTWKKILL